MDAEIYFFYPPNGKPETCYLNSIIRRYECWEMIITTTLNLESLKGKLILPWKITKGQWLAYEDADNYKPSRNAK
jgi:hypothetical protein